MCALAVLATATGEDTEVQQAHRRLADGVSQLAATSRVRALGLCQARLAGLHLATGDRAQAATWAGRAADTASGVHSYRLDSHLAALRPVLKGVA